MAPSTFGKTSWRGGYCCGCMIQSIEDIIEPRLKAAGYHTPVNIYQFCYSGSVSASAGTHDGGGALDHQKGSDGETKIWRECGVADWQRGSPEDSYFDDHNHGIWQGCPHLSSGAADQVTDYKNGRDGLADGGPDQSPDVKPITWQDAYDKYIGPTGGVLGMTDIEKESSSKDQKFTNAAGDNDTWHLVKINDDGDLSLLTGPQALYFATTNYTVTDLADGDVAFFRYVIQNDDVSSANKPTTTEYTYPPVDVVGNGHWRYGQLVWINDVGGDKSKDVKRRLRLQFKPPAGKTVTVHALTSRAAH